MGKMELRGGEVERVRGGWVVFVHQQSRCCYQSYRAKGCLPLVLSSGRFSPGFVATSPYSKTTLQLLWLQVFPVVSRSIGRCMENRHLLVLLHTVLGALVVPFFGCWVTCSPCHCVQVERGAEILHSVLLHYMSWRDDLLPQH